ncbi:relaxase/mobilization nuclease domain-containing protein [Ruminococcus flavefaciens]|uniref:Relaxase/Mobilisation nuclease domain-containing protein n=1 Tax=Ruminococcus flavefaciens TaxID=1265 RepID=A0A1M7KIY7_RUMFL|nr:relaxase/mobilization nuclease domain-containing protein [Ruminococcus flavefaciens]SHM65290.1 Relaxase/Mobilisation nuclease domain-containing protein [Ruminococcus flavefaciens]
MGKDYDILKVITHADGGEEYSKNATEYPSKGEDCVGLRGYGVDPNNPETAKMQFDTVAEYFGNEGKNEYIQFVMSYLKETAPDAETSMEITDQVLDPLKESHLILIGNHKKPREKSNFHGHGFVGTTDMETGKLLYPNNKLNFTMAQRMADIIQKPVELVIEKKKVPSTINAQNIENSGAESDQNTVTNENNKDFTRVFYPHNYPKY